MSTGTEDVIHLAVTVHTPFRVTTGSAGRGVDATVDPDNAFPASSLKGVMRAAARDLLGGLGTAQQGGDPALIREVLGDEQAEGAVRSGSPWHWEDAAFPTLKPQPRNRIRISESTGTVAPGALLIAEELPPAVGSVEIWRSGSVPPGRRLVHHALLRLSARLVDGIGSDRRAGSGWVSLTPAGTSDAGWGHLLDLLTDEVRH
jgi:CRISPR/Cas system CMR subunit Cmr4 (Cas7 group RAMP superfamily)